MAMFYEYPLDFIPEDLFSPIEEKRFTSFIDGDLLSPTTENGFGLRFNEDSNPGEYKIPKYAYSEEVIESTQQIIQENITTTTTIPKEDVNGVVQEASQVTEISCTVSVSKETHKRKYPKGEGSPDYRKKREKNNKSSKASRVKRKERETNNNNKLDHLEWENRELKRHLTYYNEEVLKLKAKLIPDFLVK
jgi:hypothetical protein